EPKSDWIRGDEEKANLPGQSRPYKSVKESWVRDRRRISPPNQVKHEVKGSDDEYAPNCRNPECNLRKSHVFSECQPPPRLAVLLCGPRCARRCLPGSHCKRT